MQRVAGTDVADVAGVAVATWAVIIIVVVIARRPRLPLCLPKTPMMMVMMMMMVSMIWTWIEIRRQLLDRVRVETPAIGQRTVAQKRFIKLRHIA